MVYLFYLAAGLIVYWPVMRAGFYGDDWMFLDVVSKAQNALVAFANVWAPDTREEFSGIFDFETVFEREYPWNSAPPA